MARPGLVSNALSAPGARSPVLPRSSCLLPLRQRSASRLRPEVEELSADAAELSNVVSTVKLSSAPPGRSLLAGLAHHGNNHFRGTHKGVWQPVTWTFFGEPEQPRRGCY
jgi:hypothetical protein